MENNELLNGSELLSAFMDGEIEPEQSGRLFYEMAQNPELQDEMRQLIGIKSFFPGTMLTPPESLKTGILASTGLKSAASSGTGFISGFLAGKPFLMSLSAILASVITFFAVSSNQNEDLPQNLAQNSNSISQPAKMTLTVSDPVKDYLKKEASYFNSAQDNINSNQWLSQTKKEFQDNQVLAADRSADEDSEGGLFAMSSKNHKINSSQLSQTVFLNNSEASPGKVSNIPFTPMFTIGPDEENFSLQIRGFAGRSFPDHEIPSLDNPKLNNMSLGIFYKIDDNSSLGIEIGQENILQSFSGKDKNGINRTWDQNYLAFWGGAVYQYSFNSENNVKPISRIFLGGTSLGPMARAVVGLQLQTRKFNFLVGLEGSSLMYAYQGNIFMSQKFGLTFGAGFNFN